MTTKTITVPLELTKDEAYRMLHAGEKVRGALALVGSDPR